MHQGTSLAGRLFQHNKAHMPAPLPAPPAAASACARSPPTGAPLLTQLPCRRARSCCPVRGRHGSARHQPAAQLVGGLDGAHAGPRAPTSGPRRRRQACICSWGQQARVCSCGRRRGARQHRAAARGAGGACAAGSWGLAWGLAAGARLLRAPPACTQPLVTALPKGSSTSSAYLNTHGCVRLLAQAPRRPPALPGQEQCPQCSARFDDIAQLIHHVDTVHLATAAGVGTSSSGGAARIVTRLGDEGCPHCGASIDDPAQLVAHVQTCTRKAGGAKDGCSVS